MLSLRNFEKSPAIYSISVDSRSRPPGEPVNRYHIDLNNNLQRVRTVQLGSIYIPAQAIQAIGDTLNNNIQYMEPLYLPGPATLVIQESLTVTEGVNSTVTVFPPVTITLPPTLNPIVSVGDLGAGSPNPVVTAFDHGLDTGLLVWPKVGLTISVVGGLYPAPASSVLPYGPQVNTGTSTVTGSDTFDFLAGYLDTLAPAPHAIRNSQLGYTSFVYAQPPTLSELLMILNDRITSLVNPNIQNPTGNSLLLPISFSIHDVDNSLVITAAKYDQVIGKKRFVVNSSILSSGTLNPFLGLNTAAALSLNMPRCFVLSDMPYVTVAPLNHGTYLQSELEPMVTQRLTPLNFTGLAAADRTFHWADTAGVDQALVLPQGRYTGTLLATVLQELMQTATGSTNYRVTFESDGRFTFYTTTASAMGLNFLLGAPSMASKLGFQNQNYSSAPSYTSMFSIGTYFPVTGFQLIGDTTCQKFTLAAQSVPSVLSNNTVGSGLEWTTLTGTVPSDFVPGGFYPFQVVQFTLAGAGPFPGTLAAGDVLTGVIDASWPGTTGSNTYMTLLNTASIAAPGGIGAPDANVNVYTTPLRRPVAQFLFSAPQTASELLGFTKQLLPVNPSLGQIMNPDEPNVYFLASGGGVLGLGAASSFTGPFLYNLLGPDYILMRVLNDCDSTTSNEHSYNEKSWSILAKMYLRPNYQHISEEMLHVAFSGMKRITSMYVEFINPDGTLVDFNGRDHTYSLLFTAEIKFASTICM